MQFFIQVIGWIGAGLVVGAYLMVSRDKIRSDGFGYQIANLAAAIGVGVNVAYQKAWPALALQVAWAAIAIYSLLKKPAVEPTLKS